MTAPGNELDGERKMHSGLTLDERPWSGTWGAARPSTSSRFTPPKKISHLVTRAVQFRARASLDNWVNRDLVTGVARFASPSGARAVPLFPIRVPLIDAKHLPRLRSDRTGALSLVRRREKCSRSVLIGELSGLQRAKTRPAG